MIHAWMDFNDAADQSASKEENFSVDEMKALLLLRLKEVLYYLFPSGMAQRDRFYIGDIHGNKGESLVVDLSGSKAGMWHDFATGEGGDIISLWAGSCGMDTHRDFPAVISSLQEWLRTAPRPVPKTQSLPEEDLGPVTGKWDYLDADGNLIACVYRYDPPSGKQFRPWDVKVRKHKAPEPRPLYNQPGIALSDSVILVEGEKSAQALIDYGFYATTAMNGASAPIDKTDWAPLAGKHVLIWPDHDEPGRKYAEGVAAYLKTADIASLTILVIPDDKPAKWDAADAAIEQLDIRAFISSAAKTSVPVLASLPAFTVGQLLDDDSPMPDDIIAPRVLTPNGLLVFGGAPKVGKTDLLIAWMAHMAAGLPFLGMKPARPLKIYYLQAEIGYHYLRERLKQLNFDHNLLPLVRKNLVITPQIRMLLDENGINQVRDSIQRFFTPSDLDIITIDPLRNLFDPGENGNENDNTAMMFFLQERVERLRYMVNPQAGIILAHHTKKITKKLLEEDPFQGFSGAGSLRGFYTSGIIMFRPDEQRTPRQLIFELRNGNSIPTKWVDKVNGKWCQIDHESERLVNKTYGEKLDAERRRKHDVILQILFDEARKGNLYTSTQFCLAFENKAGLGGKHSIRDRIDVLSTKGYIKYSKGSIAKSKFGLLCVEDMEVPAGESVDQETGEVLSTYKLLFPTHYKSPSDGGIIPVENPSLWIYHEEVLP